MDEAEAERERVRRARQLRWTAPPGGGYQAIVQPGLPSGPPGTPPPNRGSGSQPEIAGAAWVSQAERDAQAAGANPADRAEVRSVLRDLTGEAVG